MVGVILIMVMVMATVIHIMDMDIITHIIIILIITIHITITSPTIAVEETPITIEQALAVEQTMYLPAILIAVPSYQDVLTEIMYVPIATPATRVIVFAPHDPILVPP